MDHEGPELANLLRRIQETPEDFLARPRLGDGPGVVVATVVAEVMQALGGKATRKGLRPLQDETPETENLRSVSLLLAWLVSDDWFLEQGISPPLVLDLLVQGAGALAQTTASRRFFGDPERREWLARYALAKLGYRPRGETREQAEDRLTSLSATEQRRALKKERIAEKRAREVREALAREAAAAAADKWTRE